MSCKDISAIILAAGKSARLGKPKQLLPWQGTTLLGYTLSCIQKSGIEDIVLVLGAYAEEIKKTININDLRIVVNTSWQTGKASSIRAGLNAISKDAKGMMIFLCDQPYLTSELIKAILQVEMDLNTPIIAPVIGEQIINPVLFKKEVFSDFYLLQGEEGGKNLFKEHTIQRVPWKDTRILLDIDTPDDLDKLN